MQWLRVEEEIQAMDEELAKAGVQMPTFGSIGGVLAKEVRINTYIYIYTWGLSDPSMYPIFLHLLFFLYDDRSLARTQVSISDDLECSVPSPYPTSH